MGQPQVHVALRAERGQHPVLGAVQTGEPEHRQPLGQLEVDLAPAARVGQRRRQPLRRGGHAELGAQPAPQLGLPGPVGRQPRPAESTSSPARQRSSSSGRSEPYRANRSAARRAVSHRRPPRGRSADRRAGGSTAARPRCRRGPRRGWPGSATPPAPAATGSRVGIDVGDRGQRAGHQPADRREVDPGTDPESIRHLLGQPALHAAGGHRHDLGRERVRQRVGQQVGQVRPPTGRTARRGAGGDSWWARA